MPTPVPDRHEVLARARAAYDAVAADYASLVDPGVSDNLFDAAALDVFAGYYREGGTLVDLGCGPGRIAAYLARAGVSVSGMDLSPEMIAQARRLHPGIGFVAGDLTNLPYPTDAADGALMWYSLIHLAPADRPLALAEAARVLRAHGRLLLAFQSGADDHLARHDGYGHAYPAPLDIWRMSVPVVTEQLAAAGFEVTATWQRAAEGWEPTPQAYLFARLR